MLDWTGVETVSIILCYQPLYYSEIFSLMVTKIFNAVCMLSVHLPLPYFSLVVFLRLTPSFQMLSISQGQSLAAVDSSTGELLGVSIMTDQ